MSYILSALQILLTILNIQQINSSPLLQFKPPKYNPQFVSCVLLLVLSCLLRNCCWLAVCSVVVVLCVCVVILCVYVVLCEHCFFFFPLDAGLLARSQYPEGPATGHLDTGFSWFLCA